MPKKELTNSTEVKKTSTKKQVSALHKLKILIIKCKKDFFCFFFKFCICLTSFLMYSTNYHQIFDMDP